MGTLRTDPVAIVLAAGGGTRFGPEPKLLAPLGKRRLIEWTLRTYEKARRVKDVVVVVPPGGLVTFAFLRSPTVHLVENPDPTPGMISSIRAGLDSGWVAKRDFLLAPADVPFVPPELVDRMVSTFWVRQCRILIPTYEGMGGHPGLYASDLKADFTLHGDAQGAREILMRHRASTVRWAVSEPDVCFDVDTPEDLALALDGGARWARVLRDVQARKEALGGSGAAR